jgi:hypothetical protein
MPAISVLLGPATRATEEEEEEEEIYRAELFHAIALNLVFRNTRLYPFHAQCPCPWTWTSTTNRHFSSSQTNTSLIQNCLSH